MSSNSNNPSEQAALKAALIKFAATLDLHDLPEDEALNQLYDTDPQFRIWYHEAPELQPMHEALHLQFELVNSLSRVVPRTDIPSNPKA